VRYCISVLLSLLLIGLAHAAQTNNSATADRWFANNPVFPRNVDTRLIQTIGFETLHSEALAERLRFFWEPTRLDTNVTVILMASIDHPGHWQVRDWRSYPMSLSGTRWQTRVPVDDVSVPILYYLQIISLGKTNFSPMRISEPRELGLEGPTRPFWPFLEGFEQGIESWSPVNPATNALSTDNISKNGYNSLKVSLPANAHSATLATTRLRGWQIKQSGATGLRLWLRTKGGTGRARFTLYADAHTTNQVVAVSKTEAKITDQWQPFDLPFESFPHLPLGNVDLLSIEFTGKENTGFLIDDMQLLGPWKTEG
jgi:hypothetical protein